MPEVALPVSTAFKEVVTRFEAARTSRRLKLAAQDGGIMGDGYFKDELDSLLLCILETTVRVIDQLAAMPPDREVTALEPVELCLWAPDRCRAHEWHLAPPAAHKSMWVDPFTGALRRKFPTPTRT